MLAALHLVLANHSFGLLREAALVSFFALVIPYVGFLILYEKWHRPTPINTPPRLWEYLYLPLMVAAVMLAAVLPWLVVGLLT